MVTMWSTTPVHMAWGKIQGLKDHFPQPRLWLLLHLLPSLALYRKTTAPHRQVCLPQLYPHTEVTWGA